jgi:hypothetical protein
MKIRGSVNRRSFTVEPAGYFNVLRPGARFVPRVSGDFRYLPGQTKDTAFPQGPDGLTVPPFELISTRDRSGPRYLRLLRPALIVLGAIALTLFFVWWSAGWPRHVIFFN